MKNLTTILFALFTISSIFILSSAQVLAQETKIVLPTNNNTSSFTVVGTDANRKMKFFADGGFYVRGDYNAGTIPITGAGIRMMFYPKKAAFRAGYVYGTQWDDANIGNYSTAMGDNTTASGNASFAVGYLTIASGENASAMGSATASGDYSTAFGVSTTASGDYSTAMGYVSTASGVGSIAFGVQTTASGHYSIAMGHKVSTNNYSGCLAIGDYANGSILNAYQNNMMIARFSGGYTFYSNSISSAGVTVPSGGSSWSSASDSTKKENIISANGEYFLSSISKLRLGSWNYKGQDPKTFRHYGPMAQEIFHYFGKDEFGTIGCDTLLATADMDGIMMIALQALETRSKKLDLRCEVLEKENKDLQLANEKAEVRSERLEKSNAELVTRVAKLEKMVTEILKKETVEVATNNK